MHIRSAVFLKGIITEDDEVLTDGIPQVAFIGRSNVGKSSVINLLLKTPGLARTSATPGHTKAINFFFVNKSHYVVDLPGYGFAKGNKEDRGNLLKLIEWYLIESEIKQKAVVLIIDANVGLTDNDLAMLDNLEGLDKNIIVVANKIDKLKKNDVKKQIDKIASQVHPHLVIPFSAEKKIGVEVLSNKLFDE